MGVQSFYDHVQAKFWTLKFYDEMLICHTCGSINHLWPCAGSIWSLKFYVAMLICHTHVEASIIIDHVQAIILNFEILGKILVCHSQGPQSSLTMCRLDLNFKILWLDHHLSYLWGHQSSMTMFRLNLNFEILDRILVCHIGGQSSLIFCRLYLNFKILGRILVCHTWGVSHLWPCSG